MIIYEIFIKNVCSKWVTLVCFQSMGRIVDNHLSHPMLKVLLPELRNLLHDTSEVVRVAFLDLLLKIKGIRSIKVSVCLKHRATVLSHLSARF